MLTVRNVKQDPSDLSRILTLYERSFPENERRPLDPLLNDPTGSSDVFSFYSGDSFVGFICLLTWNDLSHILYFAVEDKMRGQGFGSEALHAIHHIKSGCRILADLEAEDTYASNNDQRQRRRQFYLRSGYTVSEVRYHWRRESYEILVFGGTVTENEFGAFWQHFEEVGHGLSQY